MCHNLYILLNSCKVVLRGCTLIHWPSLILNLWLENVRLFGHFITEQSIKVLNIYTYYYLHGIESWRRFKTPFNQPPNINITKIWQNKTHHHGSHDARCFVKFKFEKLLNFKWCYELMFRCHGSFSSWRIICFEGKPDYVYNPTV